MSFILFDGPERDHLLPFTYVRPVAHIRLGIDRLIDKWEAQLHHECGVYTQSYLQKKSPFILEDKNTFINAAVVPNQELVNAVLTLAADEAIFINGQLIAVCTHDQSLPVSTKGMKKLEWKEPVQHIKSLSDIFLLNDAVLREDFQRITKGRTSAPISTTNRVLGQENIFLEENAIVECATLNAHTGPIYIGKNVEIMEGSLLRGSLAICDHSIVKMGAKIYGGTTLGPFSKMGGEINNSVVFGYSNKAHEGYLGNAVLGEWCNIGAGTDASNLKNSFGKIRVWNYTTDGFAKTNLQFCGLLMGDFSRCSIHTSFNTATVVGIGATIFGNGFPRNFIPSFTYGGPQGMKTFLFDKAIESIQAMMDRKSLALSQTDKEVLQAVFDHTSKYRKS